MKRVFALFLTAFMLLGLCPAALAQLEYEAEFSILGTAVGFENEPYSDGKTVFVPMEELCSYLNLSVTKDGEYYTVVRNERTAVIRTENMVCTANGTEVVLSAHPLYKNGLLYVPGDFFEVCLGIPASKSADGRSMDITPNIYTIDIDEKHAAAVSGASPDADTLAIGETASDALFEPGAKYDKALQKSVYYLIDLADVSGLDISEVNLGLYLGKGGNNNPPSINVVRTAIWEKGNISYNNRPTEYTSEITASISLGSDYAANMKNFKYNSFNITSLVENALKEGSVLAVKVQGFPWSNLKSAPKTTQAAIRGVNTQYAPKVYVSTEESFTFPVKKNDLKMSDASDYDDIKLLASLGIVTTEDEFPMNLTEAKISRGDFVKFAMRLKNNHRANGSDAQHFSDVPTDNEYFKAVAGAYAEGIVTGEQGSLFRPYDAITVNEACAVIGRILGYDEYALRNGGYAQGYIKAATRVSLLSGAKNENGVLTYQGAARMLVNSLDAPMFVPNVFTSIGTVEYIFDEGTTVLTECFDATQIKGTVTANEYSYCGGSLSVAGSNHVVIDGKELSLRYEGYKDFLGYEVKAYYNNDNELLYMGIKEGSVSTVDLSQVVSVSPENGITIKYEEDGNTRSISFSTGDVIYNGKVLPSYNVTKEKFEVDGGELVKLSNGRVIVKAYTDMIAYAVNCDDEVISDKYDARGKVLNLANADYYTITDTDGNEIKLEDIKAGSVLSVAKSLDGKIAYVIASEKKITGTIQSVTDSGDDTVLEIAGLSYKTANRHKNWTDKLGAGKSGTFYIDAFGKICDFESGEQENVVGYLIDMDYAGGGLSKKLQAAIMVGTSEKYVLYNLADKVKIGDAPKEGNHEEIQKQFCINGDINNDIEKQAILFSTNSEGEINKISKAVDATDKENLPDLTSITDETLVKNYHLPGVKDYKYYYNYETGRLTDWFYWDIAEKPAVIAPAGATSLDDYKTMSGGINADRELKGDIYTLGYNTPVAELVVLTENPKPITEGFTGIVQKTTMQLNEDGDYINTLHVCTAPGTVRAVPVPDGKPASFYETLSEFEYGDIVSVTTDNEGEIYLAAEYYDYDTHTIKFKNTNGVVDDPYFTHAEISDSGRMYGGSVISKKGGYVKIAKDTNDLAWDGLRWIDVTSTGTIYKYTADRSYVDMQKATIDDILDYDTVPYAYSGLLVLTDETQMVTAYIVELNQTEGTYSVSFAVAEADKNDGVNPVKDMPQPKVTYPALDSGSQWKIAYKEGDTDPERKNYTFMGWDIAGTETVEHYNKGDMIPINGNTVLVATWRYTPTLTFTFIDDNGNSFTDEFPVEGGKSLSDASTKGREKLVKEGYVIEGWELLNEDGSVKATYGLNDNFTPEAVAEGVTVGGTFKAKWRPGWSGKPATGDGVPTKNSDGYYKIYTPEDLAWFSNLVNGTALDAEGNPLPANPSANAVLMNNITLNDADSTANNWDGFQIGSEEAPFTGIFDGNDKKIINYYEKSSGKYSGLFEVINGATIKKLTLENAKVEWGYGNSDSGFGSVVCGRANGSSIFNNVHVSGSAVALSDKYFVGFGSILGFGGAGTSNRLTITDCSSSVNIDSSASTMAPVSGETYIGVGGIVGMSERNATLTNCTNSGTINAPKGQNVGGIMGNSRRATNKFVSCTNTGNITGYVSADAIASYKPTIDATCNAGGIVTVIPAN